MATEAGTAASARPERQCGGCVACCKFPEIKDPELTKPANVLCLECHGPSSPNGPRAASIEQHTHHKAGSAGSECIACHMPRIQQTVADVNVRAHTFRFIPPEMTDKYKIPNSCNTCHKDKSTSWAEQALKQWNDYSPWHL